MEQECLLVVDVQPSYDASCGFAAEQLAKELNESDKPVIFMYVGDGLTTDTAGDVQDYLLDHGVSEDVLTSAHFIEKDYGFFRQWMDCGVPAETIIQVGQKLKQFRLNDSRNLDWAIAFGDKAEELAEDVDRLGPIWMPSFDALRLMFFKDIAVCGGGAGECLAEMELWLTIMGITHTRLHHLVYH